jgi:RNA-directed DNA polymerase
VRQAPPARTDSGGDRALSLIEQVVRRENLLAPHARVVRNAGAPGVDGMTVDGLMAYCRAHWARIREQLLSGTYVPQPVRRVEIPKPGGTGRRTLGIPTVLDRFIQQALLQVLSPIFDPTFSDASYGFRPKRSAHQAVQRARSYIAAGHRWVVDMDLEKCFDRVNHDVLMARVARRVKDTRVLLLIRRYLQAGMMEDGLVSPRTEGTPQGGPLSPLLSNILLDEWDRELERRGHRFVRYADDCNVYVRSKAAGERVLASLERWLLQRLRLRMNRDKGGVLLSHRLRSELRWLGEGDSEFSTRWRYRLLAEKEFATGRGSIVPYLSVEPYFDSRCETVNRIRLIGGTSVVWSPRAAIEANVTYQHDSHSSTKELLALNLILHVFVDMSRHP